MKPLVPSLSFLLCLAAAPAFAAMGEWIDGDNSRIRLVAAGVGEDGRLDAAIEIELDPGWKTYWRTPGDAGIPPLVDFSASSNLGPAEIAYPLPHRYDDGFGVSNIYEDRVVLPLKLPVVDRSKASNIALALDIGVCDEVCIPVHFDAELAVPPDEADAEAGTIVTEARAVLPAAPEAGVIAAEAVKRDGGTDKKPEFLVTLDVPDPASAEVYVEGPADWYAGEPQLVSKDGTRAIYRVKANLIGAKTPIDGATFRVTIVSGDRAVEQTIGLD